MTPLDSITTDNPPNIPTSATSFPNLANSSSISMSPLPALDLLKSNPFLLPAQLLALNPNLYAAQFAQLQAAQLMLAKQQQDADLSSGDRKRPAADDDAPLDLGSGSRAKYARSSSPAVVEGSPSATSGGESPLDLSGNKSPDLKQPQQLEPSPFNPLLPPNILSFFNQLKPPGAAAPAAGGPTDFTNLLSLAASKVDSPAVSSPPRTSPWQAQWLNKHPETAGVGGSKMADVFKAKHNMSFPGHALGPGLPPAVASSPSRSPISMSSPVSSGSSSPKTSQPPARDILKEQLPLPRKLVRGQDVWIGRADQQTRDILKCMGCGQSFRSLDLLTKHMQETQHYKKVISHDQLSAWKYPDAGGGGSSSGSHHSAAKNHVNSVLTCKVCEKPFGSLKELSEHMVKANHYTGENRGRSAGGGGGPSAASIARERKKALSVKKLLELERARFEVAGGLLSGGARGGSTRGGCEQMPSAADTGKLFCERCEERIPLDLFISHIQQCVGRNHSAVPIPPVKTEEPSSSGGGGGGGGSGVGGPLNPSQDRKPLSSDQDRKDCTSTNSSILGSLEQMVKGNFQAGGSKKFHSSPGPGLFSPTAAGLNKFSVANLIPRGPELSSPSSSSVSSKPSSPVPASGLSALPPLAIPSASAASPTSTSLEKSAESPNTPTAAGQTNGKIKQEIDSNNQTDGSAASPSSSSALSCSSPLPPALPPPLEINDEPVMKGNASPDPLNASQSIKSEAEDVEKRSDEEDKMVRDQRKESSVKASTPPADKNPLAALQLLCDTQRKTPKTPKISETTASVGGVSKISDPAALMAFSWACNQASAGGGGSGGDSSSTAIKCPFCDTPFISKGAYRHHLSKMHFTKDPSAAPPILPADGATAAARSPSPHHRLDAKEDDSIQSKYAKYAQLALKQLSCNQK